MDNKSVSFFAVGLLSGIVACTAVFSFFAKPDDGAASGVRALKLAHGLDTAHPVHVAMDFMGKRLEELSGGTMKIDIYPSGVLGSEVQCIEQIQSGSLAMTKVSTAAIETFIPELGVFGVPYLFRDESHFWEVVNGEIGHELLGVGEASGLRGLCYYDAGSRNFYSTKRPIRSPADLKGMKIRVQNSRIAIEMIEAMGGSPTPIAWGELYSALAQGVVDGAENNPPSYESSRHFEVAKFFTPDAHTMVPDMLVIGTKIWSTLNEQQRGWLIEAAEESSVYQRKLWADETRLSLERVVAAGVVIVDCDPAEFQKACEPLSARLSQTVIGPWMRKIQAVQ